MPRRVRRRKDCGCPMQQLDEDHGDEDTLSAQPTIRRGTVPVSGPGAPARAGRPPPALTYFAGYRAGGAAPPEPAAPVAPRLDRRMEPTVPDRRRSEASGAAPRAPLEQAALDMLADRYVPVHELGRGGMGVVYLATDTRLLRRVALKFISLKLAGDPAHAQWIRREAVALASIRNQHIVQIHSFEQEGDYCFFSMEYVCGRNLRQILEEHGRHDATIPLHRTLTILERIADGIQAVHAAGLVHRDVKPANIVIEDDTGRPVLVDFGLAIPSESAPKEFEGGTPIYIAPEQTWLAPAGSRISPRTDVYSLACVAFEMLTGRVPFESDSANELIHDHMYTKAPVPSSYRAELAPLDAVFQRALAKDPAERYDSCPAFVTALCIASGAYHTAREPPGSGVSPRGPRFGDRPMKILVVDDDPSFRRFAMRAVQLAFYGALPRILTADTGMTALSIAAQEPADLVLLDLDMPGLDGLDTLSRLRALPFGDRTRVLVLSANAHLANPWRFAVLGVNDFLDKPIDLEALVRAICAIAEGAGWIERQRDERTDVAVMLMCEHR
jgi:eukaryotic-like serine/threonine-protein kinase